MYGVLLILLWLPGMNSQNACCVFGKIRCSGIQQEDFFDELFRNENDLASSNIDAIEILDSNYTVMDSFMDPRIFFSRVNVLHLKIKNSSIQTIAEYAFQDLNRLITLDLSHNRLKKISFIGTLNYLTHLDLSDNNISILDLNVLRSQSFESLYMSDNSVEEIVPLEEFRRFSIVDLSHNKLLEFNETLFNCVVRNMDLRHNFIRNLSILDGYSHETINLEENIITSLSSDNINWFICDQLYLTNIPNILPLEISIQSFSVRNCQIETLNETAFDIKKLEQVWRHYFIDFSNSSIRDISENYFSNIDLSLNLSHNNISVMEKSIFKNSFIRNLDISYSSIRIFSNNVFKDTNILEVLNLTGNHIEVIEDICKFVNIFVIDLSYNMINSIEPDSFGSCTQLYTLNISSSQILTIEPEAFTNLRALNVLSLSNNRFRDVNGNIFRDLEPISVIDLSGSELSFLVRNVFYNCGVKDLLFFNANIRIVGNKAFNYLFRLENLNLSYTGITDVEDHAFFNLPALITLDLSNNNLTVVKSQAFSNLPISFLFLNGNKIKTIQSEGFVNLLNLKFLNLSDLGIQTLESCAFSALNGLDTIDLSRNNLTIIKENVFTNFPVRHIDLTKNNIISIAPINSSVGVTKLSLQLNGFLETRGISNIYLREIVFDNSSITSLKSGCFKGLYNLERLFFNNSVIFSHEPDILRGLFHLEHLDASNLFGIHNVMKSKFFADLSNLKTLKISNSNLSEVEPEAFFGLQSLEELYLGGNKFQSLRGDIFEDNVSLKFLDLSNSSFTSIDLMDILNRTKNLQTIRFSCGKLINLILRHDEDNFSNSALEVLFLDNNLIESLDSKVFHKLTNLRILHLQNNKLRIISFETFRYFHDLEELRLDGNSLKELSLGVFEGLSNLQKLNLSKNYGVFSDSYELPFRILHKLRYLNLEYTGLPSSFLILRDFASYRKYFPRLEYIYISNNGFSCSNLFHILQYFDENNIHHPSDNPTYNERNIDGIGCHLR